MRDLIMLFWGGLLKCLERGLENPLVLKHYQSVLWKFAYDGGM